MVGELRILIEQQVDVDGLRVARVLPRVREHPLDDAVGPASVFPNLRHIHFEVAEHLLDELAIQLRLSLGDLRKLLLQFLDQFLRENREVVHEVERIADLVGDPRREGAERRQLLLRDDLLLRALEIVERLLERLVLRLDLLRQLLDQVQPLHFEGVLPEDLQRVRHVGDFVVALDLHLHLEVALGHAPRRLEQAAQSNDEGAAERLPGDARRADGEQDHGEEEPEPQPDEERGAIRRVAGGVLDAFHERPDAEVEFRRRLPVALEQLLGPAHLLEFPAPGLEDARRTSVQFAGDTHGVGQRLPEEGADPGQRRPHVAEGGLHAPLVGEELVRIRLGEGLLDVRDRLVLRRLEAQEAVKLLGLVERLALGHRRRNVRQLAKPRADEEVLIVDRLLEHRLQTESGLLDDGLHFRE